MVKFRDYSSQDNQPFPENTRRPHSHEQTTYAFDENKSHSVQQPEEDIASTFDLPESLLSLFHTLLKQGYDAVRAKYIVAIIVAGLSTYMFMGSDSDTQQHVDTHGVEVFDGDSKHQAIESINDLYKLYGKMEVDTYHKPSLDLKKNLVTTQWKEKKNMPRLDFINFPTVTEEDKIKCRLSPEEKIIRCLRWKPITDAVEDRYGIPRGLLLAIMAQEGMGDPTLINVTNYNNGKITRSDGGAGLIHIQATNAVRYGLHVYKQEDMDKYSVADYSHGQDLIDLYYETGQRMDKLIKEDDRFDPIKAIDVAGRFLCNTTYTDREDKIIAYHTGVNNVDSKRGEAYLKKVIPYWSVINAVTGNKMPNLPIQKKLSSRVVVSRIDKVKERQKKIRIKVDGKTGGYDEYMKYFEQSFSDNLLKYKKQEK